MTTMQALRCEDVTGPVRDVGPEALGWANGAARWRLDPLGPDEATDEVVVTTTRRLLRLTTVAADVAARFVRESATQDPIEWMTAPRRLFGGGAAMDACQHLAGFGRSVVVHGLRLDADAAIEDVERILSDDAGPFAGPGADAWQGVRPTRSPSSRLRLLSCWVTTSGRSGRLLAFCAIVAERPEDLIERVLQRYGADAAAAADVTVGFDRGNALVDAMIGEAVIDTLVLAAADPDAPAASGLDVVVEQRFAA